MTLILGAALTLTAFDTVEEPEPECVCGAAGPLRNKTVEEQELERFLKEFPYKIFFVERWILIVASENTITRSVTGLKKNYTKVSAGIT